MASQNGHVEVVNILLQNGAHVDVQDEVCKFMTLFTYLMLSKGAHLSVESFLLKHDCIHF